MLNSIVFEKLKWYIIFIPLLNSGADLNGIFCPKPLPIKSG